MSLADDEARGWQVLAQASRLRSSAVAFEPTNDPVRARAREELGREPSAEEYFHLAAGRPAADAHRPPPEPTPRPSDPLPGERPENVFTRLARLRSENCGD